MPSSPGLYSWLKKNRIGPLFLITVLLLECLYFFQFWIDAELKEILQSLQRKGFKGFSESSLVPVGIYILVIKLGFLWRIPFLLYLFLLTKAIAKERRQPLYGIMAITLFLMPYYLALFLMPGAHWARIPQQAILPAWWIWATLGFAVALSFLYEAFEFKNWTDGRLGLPFLYLACIVPYFFTDLVLQFIRKPVYGLHIIYLLCVGFSLFFTIARKLIAQSTRKEKRPKSQGTETGNPFKSSLQRDALSGKN